MGRTDRASLLLHVPPADVFAALTSAEALERWLPPEGMSARFEQFQMREGGRYRLVLTYDDTSDARGKSSADSDVMETRIRRLEPDRRVVWEVDFDAEDPAFQGTMTMTWILHAQAEGTDLTIEATNVPDGIRAQDHAAGIASSLVKLAALLEP